MWKSLVNTLFAQAKGEFEVDLTLDAFETWLQVQLGNSSQSSDLIGYLERKNVDGDQMIYRQGDPAETIDLIAVGRRNVEVTCSDGKLLRVRRMATHTVVGEMGFFRKAVRSASISSDSPTTIFTLTCASFHRMRRERPDLAGDFVEFILRIMADRIETANREIAALIP